MGCDICGKEEKLFRTIIEGTELKVCMNCGKFGKVLGPVKEIEKEERLIKREISTVHEIEEIEDIVPNFSQILKKKRESMRLEQKDFAKKISEKESVVHKMETGEFKPSIKTARKSERILGIKLIEEYEEEHIGFKSGKSEGFTIGDLIKIKKK